MASKPFYHGTSSNDFLNALQWDGWQEFFADFIGSFHEHAPEDIKEFIGDLIASHREHAPDGIKEFADHLTEFLGHDHAVDSAHSHELDTPDDDEAASTLGSAGAISIDQAIGTTQNESKFWFDKIPAIDPTDVKEFIGKLIEPFREHAPDDVKEFFGNLAEALRDHAPEGLKDLVDHWIKFLGHDEQAATAHSHEFHAVGDEAIGTLDFAATETTSFQTTASGTSTATGSAASVGTYDEMAGGDGSDELTGGSDADTFLFNAGETGGDTIRDFTLGEDVIDISALIGDTFGVVNSDLADFVRIDNPDGHWGSDAPILKVDVTGTGDAFVDVAYLNVLNRGDEVSVMLNSSTTSDIEII